jgi:hypothetical protein
MVSNFSWSGRAGSRIALTHACAIIAFANVIAARRSTCCWARQYG